MAASVTIDPAWTLDNQNTSFNGRQMIGSLFLQAPAQTASHILWRDGVIPTHYASNLYTDLQVILPASGMNVRVNQGTGIITRTGQGPYICPNSTQRVIPLDAADVTNPRIDLIVLQVTDLAIGDGSSASVIRSVTGTPAGSPVVPAVPTGAIPLAQVAVAAGVTTITTPNITDRRKSTGLVGATRPLLPGDLVADQGEVPGESRWAVASGLTPAQVQYWDGAAWTGTKPYVVSGTQSFGGANLTPGASQIIGSVSIVWPGYAYQLLVWGGMFVTFNGTVNNELRAQLNYDNNTYLADAAGVPNAATISWFGTEFMPASLKSIQVPQNVRSSLVTDGLNHTVYLIAKHQNGGDNIFIHTGYDFRVKAMIIPA